MLKLFYHATPNAWEITIMLHECGLAQKLCRGRDEDLADIGVIDAAAAWCPQSQRHPPACRTTGIKTALMDATDELIRRG